MIIYNNQVFDFFIITIIYQNQVFDSLIITVITFDTRWGLGAISNTCPLWKSSGLPQVEMTDPQAKALGVHHLNP
jgi:hypothetical protein